MIDLARGVPGVNAPEPTTYEEFWPYYVSQHLHPVTRLAHVAGTSTGIGLAVAGAATLNPLFFVAAPIAGYGAAWVSHFTVEKNKPASFGNPLWSLRGDFRQLWKFFAGRLGADVSGVRRALRLRPEERTLAQARAADPSRLAA
jgi:hypothetical protein